MKDEPFNQHIESARHSLQALRGRLRTSTEAPGVEIAGHLGDIGTALDAAAREWSQQNDALAAIQTKIAEGVRAEEALRESVIRFRELFDHIHSGVAVYEAVENGTDFVFKDFNRAGQRIDQTSKQDVLGRRVTEVFPGVREMGLLEVFQRVWRTGQPEHHPVTLYRDERMVGWRENYIYRLQSGEVVAVYDDITERKRAELELLSAHEDLKETHRLAHIGTWDWVMENDTVIWSKELYDIAGRDPSLPAPTYAEHPRVYTPASWDRLSSAVTRALTTDEPYDLELELVRPDGSTRCVNAFGGVKRDGNGKNIGLHGTVQDITERKRAEEARLAHLRFFESMNRINRAMQGTNDLDRMLSDVLDQMLSIFDCDRASLVYPCDPAATSWQAPMERTRPEYPGALALGLEVPMDPDVVRVFRTLQASSGPVQFGPGSAYPLPSVVAQRFGSQSQIAMALYPKEGKPWMFVLQQCSRPRVWTLEEEKLFEEIGRRLTDSLTSLLTHRDLRESEQQYRQLFEHMLSGLLVCEVIVDESGMPRDHRFIQGNPAFEKLTGLSLKDQIGKTGKDFAIGWPPEVVQRLYKVAMAGEPIEYERFNETLGRFYETRVFSPRSGQFAHVFTDITARKQAEVRIRDFSRKLLTSREEERRRISAVLHHDVGSFTVGVTAHLNAVEEDLRKGKYKEALATLKKGHRLFVQSVRRLKTLARELRPPDLDILGLPAALRQHFALLTNETSLRIRFTDATGGMAIPPETQTVLFRVVQESLNNVVKHARARQVRVRLSAPRKTLRLSIVDDGKGFDPVRAAARSGMRLGLGLRAAQEMVAALGGEFMVEASPGRGTTVLVTVPPGGPKT